jgi:hypothetical protein
MEVFGVTTVLDTFEKWKSFLSDRVAQAKATGLSDGVLTQLAYQVGEFLDDKVDPKNGEERLMKELWSVGTDEEKKVLAALIVKFVEQKA